MSRIRAGILLTIMAFIVIGLFIAALWVQPFSLGGHLAATAAVVLVMFVFLAAVWFP